MEVSRIAFGTDRLGGAWDTTPLSDELKKKAETLLLAATEHGINHIDLADIYALGKSDEAVGYTLQRRPGLRDKLVLQGKVGIIFGLDLAYGPPGRHDYSYDHLVRAVETSLRRLGTDRIDLLMFHRPDLLVEPEEVARAADFFHTRGLVRYFSVSNYSPVQIELLQRHLNQPLVVNQLELNLLHHGLISEGLAANQCSAIYTNSPQTLEHCRLNNIMVQAWSPVAGGKLFNLAATAPENIRAVSRLIAELAEKKETTQEAVALGWLLRHPAKIQPIIGTQKVSRIADLVRGDDVELSRAE